MSDPNDASAPAPPAAAPRAVRVHLYVAGASPNSILAQANLRAVLGEFPDHQVELEVIDVLREPERGLRDRVLITPMLVRTAPAPEHRLLGNLRDRGTLLGLLGLYGARHE